MFWWNRNPCVSTGGNPGGSITIDITTDTVTHDAFCLSPLACATAADGGGDDQGGQGGDDQGGACSFTPMTVVTTDKGKEAIGDIHQGDKVLAYNPKTHKMELQPVVHVWIHPDDDLVDLTLTTQDITSKGKNSHQTSEVIHTNKKHPFLTIEQGFLPVGKITVGMHVLRADGVIGVVTQWKLVLGQKTMYNLEVAQDHTFTVEMGQWVVHNCSGNPQFSDKPSVIKHMFRDVDGHFVNDTPANRQLILDAISEGSLGTDSYGKDWYAKTLPDGRQVWATVRKNIIVDAGVNSVPRTGWDPIKGLVP